MRCSAIQVPGVYAMLLCQLSPGRPPRHRTLLDPEREPAILGRLEQRHEVLLEVAEVLIHAVPLVAADEPADGVHAEQHGGVEHAQHEVVLLRPDRVVVVEQVVEVADVRQLDARGRDGRLDAAGAVLVERLAQIQRVGDRIQHRLRRHVRLGRVQRRRQLDVAGAQLLRECQPLFDRLVRIRIADLAGRQLLERRRQDAHLHELRLERFDCHF